MRATIVGLQEAQAASEGLLAALKPSGALGRAIQYATATAQRASIARTPVDTGAWRASHRVSLLGARGRVFLDPGARNPRSGVPVTTYASIWDARGGRRAVYARVADEDGPRILQQTAALLTREFPS